MRLNQHPSIIVGLKNDAHTDFWLTHGPRPVCTAQWALSGAAYHPIMLDAVRRVVNATARVADFEGWRDNVTSRLTDAGHSGAAKDLDGVHDAKAVDVMEWTGPGL